MAFVHGKSAHFNLDTVGGSPTDLSAYCDSIDASFPLETAETTTFGDASKEYIAGLRDSSFSVSGPWDATIDAHMTGIMAAHPASLTFIIGPAGSTGGYRKITGECILTNYQVNPPVGDKVTWSADFQGTGNISFTTF